MILLAYWKWLLAALLLLGSIAGIWYFGHQQYAAGVAYITQQDALAAAQQKTRNEAQVAAWKKEQEDKFDALTRENAFLVAQQLAIPTRVVRLCLNPASDSPPLPRQTAAGAPSAAGAGILPQGAGSDLDIGPALYALADEADRIVAMCRN